MERREQVIQMRKAGLTYAKIGLAFGISKQWARQLVKGGPVSRKPDLSSRVMLTTADVARFLGLHPNTVRRWSNKGLLKSYRISTRGDRRFRREDVDGFLKEAESAKYQGFSTMGREVSG